MKTLQDFGYILGGYSGVLCRCCGLPMNNVDKRTYTCKTYTTQLLTLINIFGGIKAVILDFDDTLVNSRLWKYKRWDKVLTKYSNHTIKFNLLANLATHGLYTPDIIDITLNELGFRGVEFAEIKSELYQAFMECKVPDVLLPNALEFIEALHNKGIKIALITNGHEETHYSRITQTLNVNRFEFVHYDAHKQSGVAFIHALNRLKVFSHECLSIGDRPETDLIPASTLNMRTLFYDYWGTDLGCGRRVTDFSILIKELK